MTNLLKAIINIIENPIYNLKDYTKSHSRINNMGEALYENIKNEISTEIKSIQSLESSETKETGKVNKVDPLRITFL